MNQPKLSTYDNDRVWKLWVHLSGCGVRSRFVDFVTKAKFDKLKRDYDKLERELAILKAKRKQ